MTAHEKSSGCLNCHSLKSNLAFLWGSWRMSLPSQWFEYYVPCNGPVFIYLFSPWSPRLISTFRFWITVDIVSITSIHPTALYVLISARESNTNASRPGLQIPQLLFYIVMPFFLKIFFPCSSSLMLSWHLITNFSLSVCCMYPPTPQFVVTDNC